MTLAADLAFSTLDKIRERLSLEEHGDPYVTLTSEAMPEPVGSVRVREIIKTRLYRDDRAFYQTRFAYDLCVYQN
jgi:hypothetical protein